jgi:hypothetical protein
MQLLRSGASKPDLRTGDYESGSRGARGAARRAISCKLVNALVQVNTRRHPCHHWHFESAPSTSGMISELICGRRTLAFTIASPSVRAPTWYGTATVRAGGECCSTKTALNSRAAG